MDRRILERAGLNKGEAEVYLELLSLGSSLVSRIAKETGLHRTNIYDTLEKLQEKGLASHVIRENRKYFAAAPPERLLDYLREREEEINAILPELNAMLTLPRSDSLVEVFEGKEGLKTVLKDILKIGKDYLVLEEEGYIQRVLPHYYPQFNRKLNETGVKVKILTRNVKKIAKRSLMQVRELPEFPFPAATAIYGDAVAIFVWDEPYHAILIRSTQVAESYRSFFMTLWHAASS